MIDGSVVSHHIIQQQHGFGYDQQEYVDVSGNPSGKNMGSCYENNT